MDTTKITTKELSGFVKKGTIPSEHVFILIYKITRYIILFLLDSLHHSKSCGCTQALVINIVSEEG